MTILAISMAVLPSWACRLNSAVKLSPFGLPPGREASSHHSNSRHLSHMEPLTGYPTCAIIFLVVFSS
jgi:hypothetical protein